MKRKSQSSTQRTIQKEYRRGQKVGSVGKKPLPCTLDDLWNPHKSEREQTPQVVACPPNRHGGMHRPLSYKHTIHSNNVLRKNTEGKTLRQDPWSKKKKGAHLKVKSLSLLAVSR